MEDISIATRQLEELLSETDDFIANASNFTAFIFENIPNINWCGFYFDNGKELILSVFQGKVACIKIPYHLGVCGYSFSNNLIAIIDDVNQFDTHIACDAASKSEFVIPLSYLSKVIGVLDIDSSIYSRFDTKLQEDINLLLSIFLSKTKLDNIVQYYNV
ncbi:MAG TPA: GAF domain-containing protein [Candidatus Kapabacteria bacterium]|nr:GAF domain-containing protein [Candidatus Kapabacteria bacterium]